MNALTIADALAVRYAAAAVTPPSGYPNIRQSTARMPNKVGMSPFVVVILPSGSAILSSQWVDYSLEFHVHFMLAKHTGDLARDMAAMLAWLGVLMGQTYSDMDLGVTGVRKAYPTNFELVVETYGGSEWYGWDITVVVDFGETQAMVA